MARGLGSPFQAPLHDGALTMSEIDDLEFDLTADCASRTTGQRKSAIKFTTLVAERGGRAMKRRAEFNRVSRNTPSLPRLKFLERD